MRRVRPVRRGPHLSRKRATRMIGLSGNPQPLKPTQNLGAKQLAQQPSPPPSTSNAPGAVDLSNAHVNDRTWLQTFAEVTSRHSDISVIQQEMTNRGINVTPDQLTRISGLVTEQMGRGETGFYGYRTGAHITSSDAARFI